MRALIAFDGSPGADQALALAGSLAWPAGSALRVVAVVEPLMLLGGPASTPVMPPPRLLEEMVEFQEGRVAAAAQTVARQDRTTEGVVRQGRPATILVEEAPRFAADLLITGSRGHGRLTRVLLGSVSEEVVDRAPCPVLVARASAVSRIVLAFDGTAAASAAEAILASWPIFERLPIHVLSVADVMEPVRFGFAPASYHRAAEDHARYFAEAQELHRDLAEATAGRLRGAGRRAVAETTTGSASEEIIGVATALKADLVVMGSHGRSGFERMLLGSVARNVLHGSQTSVLIVHAPSEPAGAGEAG